MNKYTCSRCRKEFNNYQSLRKHTGRIHKISSINFYVEFYLEGKWPLCKCGCGQRVKWNAGDKKFRELVHGHYSRIYNNWGHNQKAIDASAKTRREQYASGERKTWNNGLTKETDVRVKNIGHKRVKRFTPNTRAEYAERMKLHRLDGTIPTLSGSAHPNWQGGVSSINQLARADHRLYKEWKYPILQRDEFKCTECGDSKDLHVHHNIETFSDIIKKVMTIDDLERLEIFDRKREVADRVVNYHIEKKVSGVTLCYECHNKLHPSLNFI